MIEQNRELLTQVASVNPGMVSTLLALDGQLRAGSLPPPQVLHHYGQLICRLGAAIIAHAERQNAAAIEPGDLPDRA